MKFGISFANVGPRANPDEAVESARVLEEAGIESLWTVEHVVVPEGYDSTYPYSSSGKMPGANFPIPDPLVWLAFVAAATERIRLGTAVLILPQRNPVILAKECATLDVLSRGRLLLGVGVGWLREEFDALGVPFERRGARTEDYIAAMRALWREQLPTYQGEFAAFERATCEPKPPRAGGVPIHIGGHSEIAARRAGRIGDGFFPAARAAEENARLIQVMRRTAVEAGRDPRSIEVTVGGRPDPDLISRYADLGVDRYVTAPFGADAKELRAGAEAFADQVMARFAATL